MNELELYEQFKAVNLRFPELSLQKKDGSWSVSGWLRFIAEYKGYQIEDEYLILLLIPKNYPEEIPTTRETGNRIPRNFHHIQDGSLCLGARLAVKQKFKYKPTLEGYIDNCLIPYLYSFSYKSKFGKMPFGELSHGGIGILEYYRDLFNVDTNRVLKFLEILRGERYHEPKRCPCRSGKRTRLCHGDLLQKIRVLQPPADFEIDYLMIVRALVEKVANNSR